jgi:Mor family transcriptional regulator
VTVDGSEAYWSRDDRIVAEYGDGYDVEGIASRYGLTVAQVYAVVEQNVAAADQAYPPPPLPYAPPPAYAPPLYPPPTYPGYLGFPNEDAIVADYGAGYDVNDIARKFGIPVEQVYEVVLRVTDN